MAAVPVSTAAAERPLEPGMIFQGGYEILAAIGAGSFARVYRARQLSTGQPVAIKVLRAAWDGAGDAEAGVARFRRELRLCGELYHPHIVPLLDCGESPEGLLYAVFQFVPGTTLRALLAAEGPLALEETLHLMAQVLDALGCAHAHGIVHRDLKPENIMITRTGVRRNALVLDFGMGGVVQEAQERLGPRLTQTHELMGTPCYAAPEQLRGEPPTARVDLYAWGLIVLECLTGRTVMQGASTQEVLARQLGPEPVPIPSTLADRGLRALLATVTAKRAEKRTLTVEALIEALGAWQPGVAPLQPAERRQLAVLCCRLAAAPAPGARPDPEALDELLHAQAAALAEHVRRAGGEVVGHLGDRLWAAFGYPQAHEHDARHAVRTATALVAETARASARLASERGVTLTARAGVHCGLVVTREQRRGGGTGLRELSGMTAQLAAQLEQLAQPGEVLLSADTHHLLRGALACVPVAGVTADDLGAPRAVFRVQDDLTPPHDAAGLSPFVGRDDVRAALLARWQQAAAGRGAALLLVGEPGIGKSRLLREVRGAVPAAGWLECRCTPETAGSPLAAVIERLTAVPVPLAALLAEHGLDVAEHLPPLARVCGLPLDAALDAPRQSPEREQELALATLVTLFAAMAARQPMALVVEDLHWADPTTVRFLGQLVQELASGRATGAPGAQLVLLTARPDFTPPWTAEEVAAIPLERLEPAAAADLARAGAGVAALPAALLDEVVRRADGVPLFVEEMTRVLVESGALAGEGPTHLARIPPTLRELLTARLDRLSFGARETAQIAAALGREFRYEVLHAAAARHEQVLRDDLRELIAAGLVYPRRAARHEAYVFKHALVREVAYETMLRATREQVHRRIVAALRQRFAALLQRQPELLAQHCEGAGDRAGAAAAWKQAGDQTMVRGAYVESIQHFERGLAQLAHLEPSRATTVARLELLESLGTALLTTRGYAAPEVEETFARAAELCDALGADVPARVLHGVWGVAFMRSDREATRRLLPRFAHLAAHSSDPVDLIAAHASPAARAFFTGDFAAARAGMERATTWYHSEGYRTFLASFGMDSGLYPFGYLAWAEWILGRPARATAVCDELLAIAAANRNTYGLAIARCFAATLARELGDAETVRALTAIEVPRLQEQKLYYWLGPATCLHGWARAMQGEPDAAVAELQAGLGLWPMIGVRTNYQYYLALLAEVHLQRGAPGEALALLDEALGLAAEQMDCFHVAELRRLTGECKRAAGQDAAAEAFFRTALELAGEQGARAYALRAATGLARLYADTGRRTAAHDVLAPVLAAFTEGHDTPDLRAAAALLAALAD